MKERKLKLWNGRGYDCRKFDDPRWKGIDYSKSPHAYVCAYSRADARRVVGEYCGHDLSDSEIKIYWSKDCWGNTMNGITPERGLWLEFERGKPIKVI